MEAKLSDELKERIFNKIKRDYVDSYFFPSRYAAWEVTGAVNGINELKSDVKEKVLKLIEDAIYEKFPILGKAAENSRFSIQTFTKTLSFLDKFPSLHAKINILGIPSIYSKLSEKEQKNFDRHPYGKGGYDIINILSDVLPKEKVDELLDKFQEIEDNFNDVMTKYYSLKKTLEGCYNYNQVREKVGDRLFEYLITTKEDLVEEVNESAPIEDDLIVLDMYFK